MIGVTGVTEEVPWKPFVRSMYVVPQGQGGGVVAVEVKGGLVSPDSRNQIIGLPVTHTFKDFQNLHDQIKGIDAKATNVPFPRYKNRFEASASTKQKESLRNELQVYLTNMLSFPDIANADAMRNFLNIKPEQLPSGSEQTSEQGPDMMTPVAARKPRKPMSKFQPQSVQGLFDSESDDDDDDDPFRRGKGDKEIRSLERNLERETAEAEKVALQAEAPEPANAADAAALNSSNEVDAMMAGDIGGEMASIIDAEDERMLGIEEEHKTEDYFLRASLAAYKRGDPKNGKRLQDAWYGKRRDRLGKEAVNQLPTWAWPDPAAAASAKERADRYPISAAQTQLNATLGHGQGHLAARSSRGGGGDLSQHTARYAAQTQALEQEAASTREAGVAQATQDMGVRDEERWKQLLQHQKDQLAAEKEQGVVPAAAAAAAVPQFKTGDSL
jgi:hypothetical protein